MSSTTSYFCTMGGMMMSHNSMDMHQRKLEEHHHYHHGSNDNNNNWDTMPVILPDDKASGDAHNQHAHHDNMHDMNNDKDNNNMHNHDHDNMDHEMNNNKMNHDSNMSMGTIMYMDGFRSALFPPSSSPPPPCLNLFHPSWTLHTPTKFIFAMIFITLIGMLVEACGVWRVKCLRKGRNCRREVRLKRLRAWEEQQQQSQRDDMSGQQLEFRPQSQRGMQHGSGHGLSDISDVSSEGRLISPTPSATVAPKIPICPAIIRRMSRNFLPECIRNICSRIWCCCFAQRTTADGMKAARRYDHAAAALHASRAWLGYLLMLAVMTYAIEFLISAVLGMVLGRYWFVDMECSSDNAGGGGVMNGAVGVGGGIGGMGLGDGGRNNSGPGVDMTMTDLRGNDGTWGGGDPCCGIDDDDEDGDNHHNEVVGNSLRGGSMPDDMREPLLSSLVGNNNAGVRSRGGGGGLQIEDNP